MIVIFARYTLCISGLDVYFGAESVFEMAVLYLIEQHGVFI